MQLVRAHTRHNAALGMRTAHLSRRPRARMCMQFSLESVNKSNAVVDRARLNFFNGAHIKALLTVPAGSNTPPVGFVRLHADLVRALQAHMDTLHANVRVADIPDARLAALVDAQKERVSLMSDFGPLLAPFILDEAAFPAYMRQRMSDAMALEKVYGAAVKAGTDGGRAAVRAALHSQQMVFDDVTSTWATLDDAQFQEGQGYAAVESAAARHGIKAARVFLPLRHMLTGLHVGASMSHTLKLLGRATCIHRVHTWRAWTVDGPDAHHVSSGP